MKFTTGDIQLSSFDHQVIGYIDVASRSPAGVVPASLATLRPTPIVEFVTPSNAVIGLSVITKANLETVLIAQRIVCDAPSTPSPTDMIVGSRQLLNPEVLASRFTVSFRGAGRVSGLR